MKNFNFNLPKKLKYGSIVPTFILSLGVNAQDIQTPIPKVGKENPNILWIYVEDMNPWMSCYGDEVVKTPNIDKLASNGVRFDRAYMTAGVCLQPAQQLSPECIKHP